MDLFDLVAKITLDSSEYEKGISNSQSSAKTWGSSLAKAGKIGITAITATTAAVVAFSVKLTKSVNSVADYGDKVDKMSQKIGISTDAYQKWDYVMQRAGTNVDNLKMGMKTLSQQAEKGSDAFQKLGISQEEVAKLSQEDLFEKTVKGLADMKAGTERTVLATQLLGRAGADLAPLLNQGSKSIEEQMKIAEKYGMVMPEETVKASAAFKDSVTTMQMTMTGFKNRALGEFLPSFTKITDGLALLFTGDMSGIDDIEQGLDEIVGKIDKMLPKAMKIGGEIVQTIAMAIVEDLPELTTSAIDILTELVESIISNLPIITQSATMILVSLVEGISKSLPTLIPAMVEAVITMVTALLDNTPLLVDGAIQLITGLAKGLIKAIPILVEQAPTLIKSLASAIISAGMELIHAGISIMKNLLSGIVSGFASIPSKVIGLARKIPTAIKSGVGSLWSIGANMIEGLWGGIKSKFNSVVARVKELASKLPKAVKKVLGIASPSKVFMELGQWIPEGLALGIERNLSPVEMASDAMADATAFTPSTNSGLIGTTEGEFGRIVAILQEWLPKMTDMDMVLDTGALVGQLARPIDNSLGTRQKNRKRGNA